MDLLFKRYASPFLLIDTLIQECSLCGFITEMLEAVNADREWEFFLHKVFDQTWNEFKESMKPMGENEVDLGATVNKSKNILKNFNPEGGE